MADHLTFAYDDNTSDLMLDRNGNLLMATGRQALSYITQNAIRTVRGELIFAVDQGVPYFTTIFASPPNLPMWEFYVKDTALSVPGVLAVTSFRHEIKNNAVNYEMVMETEDGQVYLTGGGGETGAAEGQEEPLRYISIIAPYQWRDVSGNLIYTETDQPVAGTLLYSSRNIQAEMLAAETDAEAKRRLAASEAVEVNYSAFLVTGTLLGGTTANWRNESGDVVISSERRTIPVQTMEFPLGLRPAPGYELYQAFDEKTSTATGRLFSVASPTEEFSPEYLVENALISGPVEWETPDLVIGNYNTSDYGVSPYLVATGNVTQVNLRINDETREETTYWEMEQFAGSTASVTAWVPDYFYQSPSTYGTIQVPTTPPEVDENGELINTDYTSVHGSQTGPSVARKVIFYNGLWYRDGGSGPIMNVFSVTNTYAQNWRSSPLTGGTSSIYTSQDDITVAYSNPQFTGDGIAVTGNGYAVFSIITSRGETFYNAI